MIEEANRLLAAREKIERPVQPITMERESKPPSEAERKKRQQSAWMDGAVDHLLRRLAKRDATGGGSGEGG